MKIKVLCWVRFQNRVHRYEAMTESLTRTGLLVRMNCLDADKQLADIGDPMEVEVALPSNAFGDRKVMQCIGNVARMRMDEEGAWWITGDIRAMKFRDMKAASTADEAAAGPVVM